MGLVLQALEWEPAAVPRLPKEIKQQEFLRPRSSAPAITVTQHLPGYQLLVPDLPPAPRWSPHSNTLFFFYLTAATLSMPYLWLILSLSQVPPISFSWLFKFCLFPLLNYQIPVSFCEFCDLHHHVYSSSNHLFLSVLKSSRQKIKSKSYISLPRQWDLWESDWFSLFPFGENLLC